MNWRLLILLPACLACGAFGEEPAAAEPDSEFRVWKLLNLETRAATVRSVMAQEPASAFLLGWDPAPYIKWDGRIDVLPCPLVGPLACYLAVMESGSDHELPLTGRPDDPFARGRLHLGKERALVPRRAGYVAAIKPDGTLLRLTGMSAQRYDNGLVADFNGDGRPDLAEQSSPFIPADHADPPDDFTFEILTVSTLPEKAKDPAVVTAQVAFNPRSKEGQPAEPWTWWAEDEDADGLFTIHLGPVRAGRGESRVSLAWSREQKAWIAHGLGAGIPCRVSMKVGGATEEMRAALQTKALVLPPGSPDGEDNPTLPRHRWETPPPSPEPPAYQAASLAGATNAEIFRAMAHQRWDFPRPEAFVLEPTDPPQHPQTDPLELAHALFAEVAPSRFTGPTPGAFDTLDGARPPLEGEVTLLYGPSMGCFGAHIRHVVTLRCRPGASSFAIASIYVGAMQLLPYVSYLPEYEFRSVPLADEDARRILQAAWWLDRGRPWPLGEQRRGIYPYEDTITLRISIPGASPIRLAGWIDDAQTPAKVAAVWLLKTGLPADRMAAWNAQAIPGFGKRAIPEGRGMAHLQAEARRILETYIADGSTSDAVAVALEAVEEHGWRDFRPLVVAVGAKVAGPTAKEQRQQALDVEIQRWVAEHGDDTAGKYRHLLRQRAREKAAVPGVPGGLDIPGLAVWDKELLTVTEAELKQFAPLDALYMEHTSLWGTDEDRLHARIRKLAARIPAILDAAGDPIAMEARARAAEYASDPSVRKLAALDPSRAARVMGEAFPSGDALGLAESISILRQRAGVADDSIAALAIGARSPKESDLPRLGDFIVSGGHLIYRTAVGIVRAFVTPADPLRYAWPGINDTLLGYRKMHRGFPELDAALIRRGALRDWNDLESPRDHALLTFYEPILLRDRLKEELQTSLAEGAKHAHPIAEAAWLNDLRELAPALEPWATASADDDEGGEPLYRSHAVRRILTLWHEPDAETHAKLLLAYAMGRELHPDETPEDWTRLTTELQKALTPLDAEGRGKVISFLRWMKEEGRPVVAHDITPEVASRVLDALAAALEN